MSLLNVTNARVITSYVLLIVIVGGVYAEITIRAYSLSRLAIGGPLIGIVLLLGGELVTNRGSFTWSGQKQSDSDSDSEDDNP